MVAANQSKLSTFLAFLASSPEKLNFLISLRVIKIQTIKFMPFESFVHGLVLVLRDTLRVKNLKK